MSDTIAAISTGSSLTAIGIIRLSGPNAISVVGKVFRPKSGRDISEYPDRKLVFGSLLDRSGKVIDLCLCTISRGPGSYTGEDTAELQCHGSPVLLREALESLFASGARQALAGEFTKRAFLNGRMDLTQAEAVIDLIEAGSAQAAHVAASQLGGAILRRTDGVYNALSEMASHFYAVIDYPDEDIEPFRADSYASTLDRAASELRALLSTFERGRILKDGMPAAIIGKPNVGKSSLLNALLGFERAIVTDIPGTTRDTVDAALRLGGLPVRLYDTAGLRDTSDPVERIGVSRAIEAANSSELIIAVFDGSCALDSGDKEVISAAKNAKRAIAVINKCDLPSGDFVLPEGIFDRCCRISALTGDGLDALDSAVSELFPVPSEEDYNGGILTNARHYDAVSRALTSIEAARDALISRLTPDTVLTEAEEAMAALGELTGRSVSEDITAGIFSRFCVGK